MKADTFTDMTADSLVLNAKPGPSVTPTLPPLAESDVRLIHMGGWQPRIPE